MDISICIATSIFLISQLFLYTQYNNWERKSENSNNQLTTKNLNICLGDVKTDLR